MSATAHTVTQPTLLLHIAQAVDLAVICAAVAVLAPRWRRRQEPATGWALAMFTAFGTVVIAGLFPVTDDGTWLVHSYTVALICALLMVPYLLVRFAFSLGAVGARGHRVAAGLTIAQLVVTVLSPRFPQPGEARTAFFVVFIVLILVSWTVQSVLTAIGLWRAGRGQPSLVRHRMRALSIGAMVIALDLVSSGISNSPDATTQIITTLIGVVGVCLLAVAFVLPSWLRSAWRAADLVDLGTAERGLMTAMTPASVAQSIVPAVVQLFGADGAALLDADGRPMAAHGLSSDDVATLVREALTRTQAESAVVTQSGAFVSPLETGWLVVKAGAFAPLFGPAELSLLDRISSFTSLALQRCRLFEQEARSRAAAEAATAELQTLVYSVSHDLRNPIISVLGYLDVLAQEHAGELQGEGTHYLDRISVNALYMQSLIHDLLELSRIGRSEPPPEEVSLAALAESVTQEVRSMHPRCDVKVSGMFPVVWMSELRARQLLTNLLDNAAKHGGEEGLVSVHALPDAAGGALLLVTDNGPGIAVQHRQKAFEVFERLGAAQRDIPGTGMGLPICKRIVESFGGTISLEGAAAGTPTGLTVRLALPPSIVRSWTPTTDPPMKEAGAHEPAVR